MEQTQVNLSQRSDNKESSYHVRNNIWPKSTALPYLEDFLSTSQWSIYTLEEQTLTKSKFVPRDEREQGSTFTMEKVWIGLRIFSKSHTYNTMEATSLGEQTLTKSKFAPPNHSCSGVPCSNLEIFLSIITSEDNTLLWSKLWPKSKFVPRDEREQGNTFTMEHKLEFLLRIFSKSWLINWEEEEPKRNLWL